MSKVLMFLDPTNSATLDRQLMKIREYSRETMLRRFRLDAKGEQIRITKQNAEAYEAWCQKMAEISAQYFGGQFRAVDIERSFFCFVQTGRVELAAQVLSDA